MQAIFSENTYVYIITYQIWSFQHNPNKFQIAGDLPPPTPPPPSKNEPLKSPAGLVMHVLKSRTWYGNKLDTIKLLVSSFFWNHHIQHVVRTMLFNTTFFFSIKKKVWACILCYYTPIWHIKEEKFQQAMTWKQQNADPRFWITCFNKKCSLLNVSVYYFLDRASLYREHYYKR